MTRVCTSILGPHRRWRLGRWFGFGLALAWPYCSHAEPSDDAALQRVIGDYRVVDPPDVGRQRPVDWRLREIESRGIDGSGLFRGAVRVVRSAQEVQALSGRLAPGDQLVLAGTSWRDARFTFSGRGTEQAPILIRGETPANAVFTGTAAVTFYGEHLVIMDLKFKEVQPTADGSVVFRLGNGEALPASRCIVNRIEIANCNSSNAADWPRVRMFYLAHRGDGNTIANSAFAQLKHYGQMLSASYLPATGLQQLHVLNNRFIDRPKLDDQNGYEIIQIGWSGEYAKPAGSLIQGNVFEHCDGEAEIITVKASDVFVRGNTFNGCQGALCLREADRVLVQGNTFDGRGLPNTGGVRLAGGSHLIVENTFRDLKKPDNYYYWTIAMMAASAERPADDIEGYGRAKNILIARNRFDRNDSLIAVGIYSRPEYPLLPEGIRVMDNVLTGVIGGGSIDFCAPGLPAAAVEESGTRLEAQVPVTARLVNLSVRARLSVGRPLVAGMVTNGGSRPVLLRAIGPGLAPFLGAGAEPAGNPRLELYNATGALAATNDDWGGGDEFRNAFARVGAFGLPAASTDAAMVRTLEGAGSAHFVATTTGVGLLEIYDTGTGFTSRLVNFSARHQTGDLSAALIAGFAIAGTGVQTLLIRGVGPALATIFNVPDAVADPKLELFDAAQAKVTENDNWPATLSSTFARAGAFALAPNSRDAALLVTLPPGNYSAQLTSANGIPGEALVEIYEVL